MFTRRDFLRTSVASGTLVAWGATVPRFLSRTAAATLSADRPGAKDTVLVVVQLTGGNDGLNTVVPFKDPLYAKYRRALRLPADQIKKVNDEIGLHPAMEGFASLLEDGDLAIVQGVGYPNPSQSHFRSMDIWHAASTAETLKEGWLGRALGRIPGTPAFHIAMENEASPLALAGAPAKVPSIASLEDFQLRLSATSSRDRKLQRQIIEEIPMRPVKRTSLLDFVQRTALDTYASSRRLREIAESYEPKVPYPASGLAERLRLVAQLIDAGLGARIFYVSIGGFDTHANQLTTHAELLRELSDAMTAFYRDMAARGQAERILMMTFSEFGRRARENGSRGTDHGSAAPMFLVGKKVTAGLVGQHPRLDRLDMGNLKHHTDFRRVYAAVLEHWLGVPSRDVLGDGFPPLGVIRS